MYSPTLQITTFDPMVQLWIWAFDIPDLINTPDSSVCVPFSLPSFTVPEKVTLTYLEGSKPSATCTPDQSSQLHPLCVRLLISSFVSVLCFIADFIRGIFSV